MRFDIKRIEKYLKKNKMTKKEFCKKCGFSYGTLRRIYKQDFTIHMKYLFNLVVTMKIHIKDILH